MGTAPSYVRSDRPLHHASSPELEYGLEHNWTREPLPSLSRRAPRRVCTPELEDCGRTSACPTNALVPMTNTAPVVSIDRQYRQHCHFSVGDTEEAEGGSS